jgi:hypothetical protein
MTARQHHVGVPMRGTKFTAFASASASLSEVGMPADSSIRAR